MKSLKTRTISTLKKYISLAIMLIIALTIAGNIKSESVSAADVTADFTDANFLSCVSTALGTPGSVDDAAAAALTGALSCNSSSISNISGAQYLTSITDLWLIGNSISSLTPISTLSNLTDLHISVNNISDLSPLSGLTSLRNLSLNDNNFADSELTNLNSLTSLNILSLCENNISDISGITWSGLTGLTNLNFYLNDLNDSQLTHISGLVNLTSLSLNNNNISDLTSIGSGNATLAGFASGNSISINNNTGLNGSNSVAALAEVATLQSNGATVTHNIDSDIYDEFTDANFQQCVDIAVSGDDNAIDAVLAAALTGELNCNSSSISNIAGAQHLTGITDLWFTNNSISDLTPISTLSNLTDLHIADNNISDLSLLSGLTNLTNLALDSNNFADSELTIFNSLTSLVSLSLYGNNIASLNGGVNWSGLTSLTTLNLNSNNIESKELGYINGLTTLQSLSLNHNQITTLTDLSGFVNLTNLTLNNNNISDLATIGSGNATLTGFRDNNVINISDNDFSGVEEAALTEIHDYLEATPNPATITHNINWENCSDSIDNDDDGNTDDADSYCSISFYVDYDSGSGTTCLRLSPCASLDDLFDNCSAFRNAITTDAGEVSVYVQGTGSSGDAIDASGMTITSSNINIQPWDRSMPILEGKLGIKGDNIIIDGFEIYGNLAFPGIQATGDNIIIRNNYIHDMAAGILIYGGAIAGLDGDNIKVYNNILSGNSNNVNGCGGIVAAETTDAVIINNTLYNNCDVFDDSALAFGDIAATAISAYAMASPQDTIIKQNIVYNNLGVGKTYYYEDGINVNGSTVVGGPLFDQTAAEHGTGNNLIAAANPYVNVASVTEWLTAGTGYALATSDYQIGELDLNTPSTDYLGDIRPNGAGEAGAIERIATSSGYVPPTPPCSPVPIKLDIKDTYISQIGNNPIVTLRWTEAGLQIDPDDKITALLSYLNTSPSPKIGVNNIRLKNIFVRHIYDNLHNNLKQNFESVSSGVCKDQNYIADDMMEVIENMKDNPDVSLLILEFNDDLLNLENTLVEMGKAVSSPFTDYYNEKLGGGGTEGKLKVIRRVNRGGLYFLDKTVQIDPNAKSWTDTDIPSGDTQKSYKYQLITESCNQIKEGNEVEIKIDPTVPAGEEVDVKLNLQIKVKEAYDTLMMDRFRVLFRENDLDSSIYDRMCEDVKEDLFENINSELALEYVITCFGENDDVLLGAIIANSESIIPPLVMKLKGLNGEMNQEAIYSFTQSRITELKEQIIFMQNIKTDITSRNLNVGEFVNEINIANLNETDENIMRQIDEEYFIGFSHAADLLIEKTDANGKTETYTAHTDIFGNTSVDVGKFIARDKYILKIILANENFVLPKIANIQINNAVWVSDASYSADVDLVFNRHFRYGDFNKDGEISILDFAVWGSLLKGEYEDGYELWQLWGFANLDGLSGINLLDILTLQDNWGEIEEFTAEENEITLRELFQLFGISITTRPELDAMVKVATWLDWVGTDC